MEVLQMQRSLMDYTKSLFMELQQLQDESNPDFVVEVVSLFFDDSEKLLNDLTIALDLPNVDFKKVDSNVHRLKALVHRELKSACIAFRNFFEEHNIEASLRCLQQVKQEYYLLESRLESLFKLEQQIVAADGSIPELEMGF